MLSMVDQYSAAYLGGYHLRNYSFLPATGVLGTRGGILILWNDDFVTFSNIVVGEFCISADVVVKECSTNFKLTVVYGPTKRVAKPRFLDELHAAKPADGAFGRLQPHLQSLS